MAGRAKITREENFHLTLAFLGEALDEATACATLDKISFSPFKLYSGKPGCFQRGNSAIYWLGLKSSAELTGLHTQLRRALRQVGFNGEDKPFMPHLTLAREVRNLTLEQLTEAPRFIIPVESVALMESTRRDGLLMYIEKYKIIFR